MENEEYIEKPKKRKRKRKSTKTTTKPTTTKLIALSNWKLFDGRFVRKGEIVEVEPAYGERLLTRTPAFKRA